MSNKLARTSKPASEAGQGARRWRGPLLAAAVAVAAAGAQPPAAAQITVVQPATTGQVALSSNAQQFAAGFRWSLDRAAVSDAALTTYIEGLGLTVGGAPVRAFVPVAEDDLIVATSRQVELGITHVERVNESRHIVVTAAGTQGPVRLHEDELGLVTWQGAPVCFALKEVDEVDTTLVFDLLIDRSGSMAPYMSAVREAVTRFFEELPANARCRVTSFNETYRRHTPTYGPCTAEAHGLAGLRAQGDTDIFGALAAMYDDHHVAGERQRAVVVITDGVGQSELTAAAVAAKKNATTFVYWLGHYDERRLASLADAAIYGRDDATATMARYFQSINDAVRAQQVIVTGAGAVCGADAARAE